MYKRILSILLAVVLVMGLSVGVSAAGGFNQSEYDKLKTFEERRAYLVEVDKYYASKNYNVDYDEMTAYNEACAALANEKQKATTTTKVADTDAEIIARIKKNYGITVTVGANGAYDKKAKVTQHLQNIETGLSYLGSGFTKKLVKVYEDGTAGRIKYSSGTVSIVLVPHTDDAVADGLGNVPPSSGETSDSGTIVLFGSDSRLVTAGLVVHEVGHLMDYAVHGEWPAIFNNEVYRGRSTATSGGANVASTQPDRYVSLYAESTTAEDYAECFRAAVVGGEKNSLSYGKDTVIYKKMKVIYDELNAFVGSDSRATQRAGAYLGLML